VETFLSIVLLQEEVEIFQISLSPNSAVDRKWEFERRRKRIKIEWFYIPIRPIGMW